MLFAADAHGLCDDSVMSETRLLIQPRPDHWADLPALSDLQEQIVAAGRAESLVVRGAPGSGRTTCALALAFDAVTRGESFVILTPDRIRADLLTPRVHALAPHAVRPVRTPASFAHHIVSTWRIQRADPLGPVELVTGSLQDVLLSELLDIVDAPWPDSMPETMRAMQGFRAELRDLFARAGEAGLNGEDLRRAADEFGIEQWRGAGALLNAYLDSSEFSVDYRDILRVDLSRIQALAADLVEHWEERAIGESVSAPAPKPALVIVDDLQDCTASTLSLLSTLHARGSRIIAFSDPDVAVSSYRGGEPHLDIRLAGMIDAPIMHLGDVFTHTRVLRDCVIDVTEGITQSGPAQRRRAATLASSAQRGDVTSHVAATNAQLGAHIAQALRRRHLHDGIAWRDQVVLVRSSSQASEIMRDLRRGGVPVEVGTRAFDFASQATTRALLKLIVASDDEDEQAARLLIESPLIAVDPLTVFRLVQALNAEAGSDDPSAGGGAPAPLLGVGDLLADESLWRERLSGEQSEEMTRAARMWKVRTGSAAMRPRQALWRVWSAAGLDDAWRDGAISGGEDSDWFDDQLDALVALMRVADVWEQRNPTGTAGGFAKQLLNESIPIDTISRTGVRPEGVRVLTVAQAMGRQWSVVAIVGLHDGAWPNTRLRSQIMRADLLADLGAGRYGSDDAGGRVLIDDPRSARRAVLDDERRLLAAAVSRCTTHLHIGVVSSQDCAPSSFFDLLVRHADSHVDGQPLEVQLAPAPLSMRGQVADLRRAATGVDEDTDAPTAARLLALLAREGVTAADPSTWTGAAGTSSEERIHAGPVWISPSRFEAALQCPLKWFFSSIGAEGGDGTAQRIGTLVHEIAQSLPHGTMTELNDALEARLALLDVGEDQWHHLDFVDRAHEKVSGLGAYIEGVPGRVDVEVPVTVELDGIVINGRVDRIEYVDGGVRITDLKTGSTVTKQKAEEHPQLAAYQLALEALGYTVQGAQLVYLEENKATLRTQQPLDEATRAEWMKKIRAVSDIAHSNRIPATPSTDACRYCAFTRICPAQQQGRRMVD